jgi:RNA polymerase sigma-54 factor
MLVQRHSPSLRPLTTAHLAQTMTLLSLSALELRQKIESALASNPALELVDERRCPTCRRVLAGGSTCPFCSRLPTSSADEPIVFVSPREDFQNYSGTGSREMPEDNYAQAALHEDLPHFVMRQIASELEPEDRPIVAHILTSLNEDGLLSVPLVEIARYHHISLSRIEELLRIIQHADPIGVGSPTPQEALLVQLEVLAETRPVPEMAAEAIKQGMDLLSRHRYSELGQLLGLPTAQITEIAHFIGENLYPFPGRFHWGEISHNRQNQKTNQYSFHYPDVIISCLTDSEDTAFVVEVALPLAGTLRINPLFREALQQAPQDKAEQWKSDLEQAALLVKCLQQRNHTIVRLMQKLTVLQREFILRGDAHLLPVTRATLAKDLEVHESTISRAVSGKAVQLPSGHIIPMSMFFDRSLHIRTALKQIIDEETKPLSDTEIGSLLAEQGYKVARRTVAKYRSMEGILPAHLRQSTRPQMRQSQTLREAV